MPIDKNCEVCGKHYRVPPARASSRFCGNGCANAAQTGERRKANCKTCGAEFVSKKDHGVWKQFCCRECFLRQGGENVHIPKEQTGTPPRIPKECEQCQSLFEAGRSSTAGRGDGYRLYCSTKCAHEAKVNRQQRTCVNCGQEFCLPPSSTARRPDESCCSWECRNEYYKADRASRWQGGQYHSDLAGHGFTFLERPDYVGKYMQDHRLTASRAMGRLVERGEVVIHINKDKTDNRPSNLFVCGSMSEYAKIRSGSLPWPTASNIRPAGKSQPHPEAKAA